VLKAPLNLKAAYTVSLTVLVTVLLLSGNDAHTTTTAAAAVAFRSKWSTVWFSDSVHAATHDNWLCDTFRKYAVSIFRSKQG